MDDATLMSYLDKKFEDQKELFNVKLDGIASRIKMYEEKFEDHCDDNSEKEKIEVLEKDVKQLRIDFEELKNERKEITWKGLMFIAKKAGTFLLYIIGAALLYSLLNPTFWSTIFNKGV